MLYSCKDFPNFPNETNREQLELVEENCQEKETCQIDVSREYFNETECRGTEDEKMRLWLTYSCESDGTDEQLGTDRTTTSNNTCDGYNQTTTTPQTTSSTTTTPKTPTPTPPTTPPPTQLCVGGGGWVNLDCNGGSLSIHQVL